jgi:hypothetical protein
LHLKVLCLSNPSQHLSFSASQTSLNPNSEVAGGFIGILTTIEAQRTWRNEPPPNSSSNYTDFHGFKDTPNRFENRFHHSFIIRVHPWFHFGFRVYWLNGRDVRVRRGVYRRSVGSRHLF